VHEERCKQEIILMVEEEPWMKGGGPWGGWHSGRGTFTMGRNSDTRQRHNGRRLWGGDGGGGGSWAEPRSWLGGGGATAFERYTGIYCTHYI
jgi:hypothetical protein